MNTHDLVIRNAGIIDGSGKPRFNGDVAVDGERITAVGRVQGSGRREINANGALLTPGFVDIHTHYDGQATWDRHLAPSSWHGVTTAVMGNCGVGFAPVYDHHHDRLIELMEGVEEIRGTALAEGLPWNWESFPDYLDAIDARARDIDVAALVPHGPVRVFVMGERGVARGRPAHLAQGDHPRSLARVAVAASSPRIVHVSTVPVEQAPRISMHIWRARRRTITGPPSAPWRASASCATSAPPPRTSGRRPADPAPVPTRSRPPSPAVQIPLT